MISVSIVSHGHGPMLPALLLQLLEFPQVAEVIVTLNIPESLLLPSDSRVLLVHNQTALGFGANHNHAFGMAKSPYFCVLNPDTSFITNPFPKLLGSFSIKDIGLVTPIVKNTDGSIEDSVRKFISPFSILGRRLFGFGDRYVFQEGDPDFFAEWVGGMFMLFKSSAYSDVNGFDESYFLYVEDVDICTRVWKIGYKILVCPDVIIFHDAHRASRKHWQYLRWHVSGLLRYFFKFRGQLTQISRSIKLLKK
jgi:N-acetylglucosaminyl-diphospho-decaprenol L-rhamnosyltransferase